jgi:hypothetical protein
MATKKESAQRLLDTLDSKNKLAKRLGFAVAQGLAVSLLIGYFTEQWKFGFAALLIFGLLIQFAFERMKNSIEVSQISALKDLNWKEIDLEDEEYRLRAQSILEKR